MEIPSLSEIQRIIDILCSSGSRFSELFFERKVSSSIFCENEKLEKVTTGIDQGVGIRAIFGENTIYAYTSSFSVEALEKLTGRIVEGAFSGRGSGRPIEIAGWNEMSGDPPASLSLEVPLEERAGYVIEVDRAVRGTSRSISQVRVRYLDSLQEVAIVNSEGLYVRDTRPQVVLSVTAIASDGSKIQTSNRSIGGRLGLKHFEDSKHIEIAVEAGESAARMLQAESAPAGRMTVVIASKAGGTMIHEAVGHGLEGDSIEKSLSIYSGRLNEKVASEHVTVVDDATLEGVRGSYEYDDEGSPAQRTVLIENGILKGYMLDRETARKMGLRSTGNGRRESYRYRPIVRMSNTMIAPSTHDPDEIISTVKRGLYVIKMGGGQVETSTGDFVFRVNEAYLIEDGKVTEPVRGATLIGNGPEILREIDMVGSDLGFDIGTCGKDGQHVPVADAQPTVRIPSITVGGEV